VTYGAETKKLKKKISKLMSMEMGFLEEISEMLKIKKIKIMLLAKMNIKILVLDYIRY